MTCLPSECVKSHAMSRRAGLRWDFHPSGHTRVRPPIYSLSGPSVSSFPMQWHQGMMLPVLGLGLHPLGFSGWCIFLTVTDFPQKTGISVARSKLQWTHWMKSLPWYIRRVLWISAVTKVFQRSCKLNCITTSSVSGAKLRGKEWKSGKTLPDTTILYVF